MRILRKRGRGRGIGRGKIRHDAGEGIELTPERARTIVNHMVQYSQTASFDLVSAAIADPTRRAILAQLVRGPARISDIAEPFDMTLTGFCKHVKVLERARLVKRTRRGRENTLELCPEPLRDVAHWILKYEPFWNERLNRLETFFVAPEEKSR
jgi:DNA-binding transcriptional ArsR family regulator